MTRNYDIAEFRETDDLGPTATRKLNHNFLRVLNLMLDLELEGVDTSSIADYVLDIVGDDIDALDTRVDDIEDWINEHPGGGGGVTSYNDLTDKPTLEGVELVGDLFLNSDSVSSDDNYGIEIHRALDNQTIEALFNAANAND